MLYGHVNLEKAIYNNLIKKLKNTLRLIKLLKQRNFNPGGGEEVLIHENTDKLEHTILSLKRQSQKTTYYVVYLYEMSTIAKSIKTESRSDVGSEQREEESMK